MPIVTGQTTLGSGATQLTATSTPVTALYIQPDAAAVGIGKSNIASATTGPGLSLPSTQTVPLLIEGTGQAVFNLTEVYLFGTNAHVINWLAVAR